MTSKEEEVFVNEFREWLVSVDGGLKPPRSASQHRNVVMTALHSIDSTGKDYARLFSRQDLNSWVS